MSCATRILARYLTAAGVLVAPKEAVEIFRRLAPRIKAALGVPTKAAQLYMEMAAQLNPLSKALDGVVIQRKDEQRKLDNLRVLLRRLGRATEPDSLKSWDSEDELASWIEIRLEGLDEILRSLVRIGTRLTEYTDSIQRTFAHGPYTVVNRHGFRAEEAQQALKNLDDATALVQASGFASAIYGEITLESPSGVNYAGKYEPAPDTIQLNMSARNRFDAVYTLVHEIGHRVWHKLLTEAQRDAYEDRYFGTATRAITLQERETMWEAFQAAGFDPRRVRSTLPTELREVWSAYWKERKALHWPKPAELANSGPDKMTIETVHRNFVLPKQRYVVLDASVKSVTDYGKTNVREDFAEVFAHYCSGKPLTDDAEQRFSEAIGRRVTAARPIKLEKLAIKKLVDDELVPPLVSWLKGLDQDKPIGVRLRIVSTRLAINPVGGRDPLEVAITVRSVRSASDKFAVVSGQAALETFGVMDDQRVEMTLNLNGALTPAQYLNERLSPASLDRKYLHYGLYSVLIHELTHAMEMPFMRETPYALNEDKPSDVDEYVNSPVEVRAFMQQIVDEALIWARRRVTRIQAQGSNQRLIDQLLKYSTTWERINKRLNAISRKKILSAVYDALDKGGLLLEPPTRAP